jgi:hypothetical protein
LNDASSGLAVGILAGSAEKNMIMAVTANQDIELTPSHTPVVKAPRHVMSLDGLVRLNHQVLEKRLLPLKSLQR